MLLYGDWPIKLSKLLAREYINRKSREAINLQPGSSHSMDAYEEHQVIMDGQKVDQENANPIGQKEDHLKIQDLKDFCKLQLNLMKPLRSKM